MRILLVALVLAWLAVTGWAFESGRRAEQQHHSAVEALGRDGRFEVHVASYDRGVFGSEATIVIGPAELPEGEPSAARLVLTHRIDHGPYPLSYVASEEFDGQPILARVETVPTLELESEDAIEEIPLPLAMRALFTRRDGATLWMVPDPDAGALDDPELSGDWEAVYAEVAFDYDGSTVSGELEIPRVAFDGDDGSFRLEGLLVEFDFERVGASGPGYTGASRFRLDLLSIGGPEGTFSLRDLEVENSSEISQGSWSLQVNGSLGSVEGGEGRYGGGELAMRVGGIALEPLAELETIGAVVEAEGPASDAVKAELLGAAGALWPRLMAPGPELEISRLRIETPDGEIRLAFRAGVDPSDPAFLMHPIMSLPALELDLDLSLPRPVLEHWLASPRPLAEAGAAPWAMPAELASQRVETWLEHGHLGVHDGSYVASVRVRRGTVRLNGRVVSFDAL